VPELIFKKQHSRTVDFFEENTSRRVSTQVITLAPGEILNKLQIWVPISLDNGERRENKEELPGLKLVEPAEDAVPLMRVRISSANKNRLKHAVVVTNEHPVDSLVDYTCALDNIDCQFFGERVYVIQREYLTDQSCPNLLRIGVSG
jgi:hypothetical protein